MNEHIQRFFPLLSVIALTVLFAPYVHAQDYQVTPDLTFPQSYVTNGNANSTFWTQAVNLTANFDWRIILPVVLIPLVLYILWRLIREDREYEYEYHGARGYQIVYHDIRAQRKRARGRKERTIKLKS